MRPSVWAAIHVLHSGHFFSWDIYARFMVFSHENNSHLLFFVLHPLRDSNSGPPRPQSKRNALDHLAMKAARIKQDSLRPVAKLLIGVWEFFLNYSNHPNTGLVRLLNGPVVEWSGFRMVWVHRHQNDHHIDLCHLKTGQFNNRTCLDHSKTGLVRYSDGWSTYKFRHYNSVMLLGQIQSFFQPS